MSRCRTTCQGSERWSRSGEIYLDDVNDLGHEGIIHRFMHVDSLVIPHVQHNVIESAAEYTDLDRTALNSSFVRSGANIVRLSVSWFPNTAVDFTSVICKCLHVW